MSRTPRFKFGDIIENGYASDSNPKKRGVYLWSFTRTGRMNPGKHVKLLHDDGRTGELCISDDDKMTVVGTIFDAKVSEAIAAKDAEIASLREALGKVGVCPIATPHRKATDMSENVPAGWKLVPIDPTDAMIDAGRVARMNVAGGYDGPSGWQAMLDAAPPPPTHISVGIETSIDTMREAAKDVLVKRGWKPGNTLGFQNITGLMAEFGMQVYRGEIGCDYPSCGCCADAACEDAVKQHLDLGGSSKWEAHDLIPGRSYESIHFELVTYVGVDTFHRETTHKFRTSAGPKHWKTSQLPMFLKSRPTSEIKGWFARDFADGWIFFDNEGDARRHTDSTGALLFSAHADRGRDSYLGLTTMEKDND